MKKYTYFLYLVLLAVSCDAPSEEAKYEDNVMAAPAPEEEIVLENRQSTWVNYEGELPCEDCSGIQTQLKLENSPDQKERAFELRETYLETANGDREFVTSGRYEVVYGLENDPGAMAIRLFDENEHLIKTYRQEKDGHLLLLSQEEKIIASDDNYSLMLMDEKE